MPTFTPPLGVGKAWGDSSSPEPKDRLMRYYGTTQVGETIWKDAEGWHQGQYPYQGGAQYRVFDNGVLISDTSDTGLATAEQYFLGGHTYHITDALATELIAAGFGAYINTEPVDMTWFKPGDESKFTRWSLTIVDPSATYNLSVDGAENLVAREEDGPSQYLSNNRNFWVHEDTAFNADFDATITIDPTHYGEVFGPDTIVEQGGLFLRGQQEGGINRGITINNNIFFVVAYCNIGVWKSNIDGTGFVSRGTAIEGIGFVDFPHRYDAKLEGIILSVRAYNPIIMAPVAWDDPNFAKTINLDTEAGDAGQSPTPIGEGSAGIIAAHLGYSPLVNARYRGFKVGPRGSLFP